LAVKSRQIIQSHIHVLLVHLPDFGGIEGGVVNLSEVVGVVDRHGTTLGPERQPNLRRADVELLRHRVGVSERIDGSIGKR